MSTDTAQSHDSSAAADAGLDTGCGCGGSHEHAAAEPDTGVLQIGTVPPAASADPAGEIAPGELDVRVLPHGQRHEIIFTRLDELELGGELVIVNDHDPKPLRYQTSAMWPDRFEWSYREAGPQIWRVAIVRVN